MYKHKKKTKLKSEVAMTGYKGTGDNKVHSASLLFDTKLTFTFFSNGSAQVELIDFWFTCSIRKHYTRTQQRL